MRLNLMLGLAIALAVMGAAPASTPTPPAAPGAAAPAAPLAGHPLDADDVGAWLDGFMPYALRSSDIAGAVVVVVKDGKVLTEKGYGWADVKARKPVDPETTLFRPASISKLFTWTAVMQLVEAGKLDLDRDVNAYLDFKIPPRDSVPVTLRDLMTHTGGFEETFQDAFVSKPERLTSLGQYVKDHLPERIYPPHAVPAYSNYGAALAGYIVERVSGEPFDTYVERHIFAPLDMTRSSFRQPLQASLMAGMSRGYPQASKPAGPYELINVRPAGSLSSTGADMAHFMIAQLQNGQYGSVRILQPQTAQLMHAATRAYNPPLPAMALGFYHEDRNGHQVIGHAGDTNYFHSDLHLLPDDHVGIFVSVNSLGKAGAAEPLRVALLHEFMDRYFPVPPRLEPAIASQRADARVIDGGYISSRRWDSNFMRIAALLTPVKVTSDANGVLTVSALVDAARAPEHWHEIAPFLWQDDSGENRLQANVKDGKVIDFTTDELPPAFEFMPAPAWAASWSLPLMGAMAGAFVLTLLMWPVQAIARRRYGHKFQLSSAAATTYRLVRLAALVDLLALATYGAFFMMLTGGALAPDAAETPLLWTAQLLCLLSFPAAAIGLSNAWTVWAGPGRGWFAKLWSAALLLACLAMVWFVLALKLIDFGVHY